jgi:hypothetical protein
MHKEIEFPYYGAKLLDPIRTTHSVGCNCPGLVGPSPATPFNNKFTYSQGQSYITSGGQSAGLSCRQAPIWDPRLIFLFSNYPSTVAGFLVWGALSDERMDSTLSVRDLSGSIRMNCAPVSRLPINTRYTKFLKSHFAINTKYKEGKKTA